MEESIALGLDGAPGIRDAEQILDRVREDEREAFDARASYRTDGLPTIEADDAIAEHIRPGESVVAVRPSTVISWHQNDDVSDDFAGGLYLTSQRMMLLGRVILEIDLDQIDELALAGERLLITLIDRTGLSIDVARPRLLRVQIAAALTAGRS